VRRALQCCFLSALAAGMVLGGPVDARAGIIDLIWDMSGPQMIGKGARCRKPVTGGETKCNLFGIPVGEEPDIMTVSRVWVNFEGAVYTSTGKNDGDTDYEAFHTFMLSAEPLVEVASITFAGGRIYHGAGAAFHFLFGQDFRRFGNAGFKLRPVGVEIGDRWEFALNFRLYPDGFGADQFGFGPSPTGDRAFEHTWGVMGAFKY